MKEETKRDAIGEIQIRNRERNVNDFDSERGRALNAIF